MITKEELLGEWTVSNIVLMDSSNQVIEKVRDMFKDYTITFGSQSFVESGDKVYPEFFNVNGNEGSYTIENNIISICDNSLKCITDKYYNILIVSDDKNIITVNITPKICCNIYNEIKSFKFIRK